MIMRRRLNGMLHYTACIVGTCEKLRLKHRYKNVKLEFFFVTLRFDFWLPYLIT
jgi:hypothetical protein